MASSGGLIEPGPQLAADSTGLESRHVSEYFAFRLGRRIRMSRFPKVSAVCDCATHLFLSAKVTMGPRHDICEGPSVLRRARRRTPLGSALLDAAYDCESMHVLIREKLRAESIIPPKRL